MRFLLIILFFCYLNGNPVFADTEYIGSTPEIQFRLNSPCQQEAFSCFRLTEPLTFSIEPLIPELLNHPHLLKSRVSLLNHFLFPDSSVFIYTLNTLKPYNTYPLFSDFFTEQKTSAINDGINLAILNTPFFAKDSLSFHQRVFYTGYVMLTSTVSGHIYLFCRTYNVQNWPAKFKWQNVEHTFTKPPIWDDDHWSFNYVVHPYMGSLTFLATRNRGGSIVESFFQSAFHSAFYEYFVVSSLQRPSANDMIVTPIGGLLIGEAVFRIKNKLLSKPRLSIVDKIMVSILDPYEVFRHGFDYNKMLK